MASPQVPNKIQGLPVGFDIISIGRTLIRLNDGFYLELSILPLKVLKQSQTDPEGNPVYVVQSNNAMAVWTKEQVNKMKAEK